MNSLARSSASLYGNKEELYDRLRRHAYQGKKGELYLMLRRHAYRYQDKKGELNIFLINIFLWPQRKVVQGKLLVICRAVGGSPLIFCGSGSSCFFQW